MERTKDTNDARDENERLRGPVGRDGRRVHDVGGELVRRVFVSVPVLSLLSGETGNRVPEASFVWV